MTKDENRLLQLVRTRLWVAEMIRATGTDNVYQLGKVLDDFKTGKAIYEHAHARHPISENKLGEIDAVIRSRFPNIDCAAFFHIGPESARSRSGCAPLWDALGSIEQVAAALADLDPASAVDKYQDVPFALRCGFLIYSVFGEYEPPAYWKDQTRENRVAERYRDGEIALDIDLITFAIAAWRMANFVGELRAMMNYIMIGLLDRGIPETMDLYKIKIAKSNHDKEHKAQTITITKDFERILLAFASKDIKDAEDAISRLNEHTPSYPRFGGIGYEEAHDFSLLMKPIRRGSVFEYLSSRVSNDRSNGSEDQPAAQAVP